MNNPAAALPLLRTRRESSPAASTPAPPSTHPFGSTRAVGEIARVIELEPSVERVRQNGIGATAQLPNGITSRTPMRGLPEARSKSNFNLVSSNALACPGLLRGSVGVEATRRTIPRLYSSSSARWALSRKLDVANVTTSRPYLARRTLPRINVGSFCSNPNSASNLSHD
jgi:hypothetical protein